MPNWGERMSNLERAVEQSAVMLDLPPAPVELCGDLAQGMARPDGWHPVGPWPGYREGR